MPLRGSARRQGKGSRPQRAASYGEAMGGQGALGRGARGHRLVGGAGVLAIPRPFHVKRSSLISELERMLARHDLDPAPAESLARLLAALEEPQSPTSVHDPRTGMDVHVADSLSGFVVPELRDAGVI